MFTPAPEDRVGSVCSRSGTSIALRDDRWPRLSRDIRLICTRLALSR
jgi:hypothetical protein